MSRRSTVLLLLFASVAGAADLRINSTVARGNAPANLSVILTSQGAVVTGLQFDIEFDPAVMEVTPENGTASTQAGKSLQATAIHAGKQRILIVGLNQSSLTDGAVATLRVTYKDKGETRDGHGIRLLAASGTNSRGEPLPISVHNGGVTTGPGRGGR